MSVDKFTADFVGVTVEQLRDALASPTTCPLCIEVGDGDHDADRCYMVLTVMADQWGWTRP